MSKNKKPNGHIIYLILSAVLIVVQTKAFSQKRYIGYSGNHYNHRIVSTKSQSLFMLPKLAPRTRIAAGRTLTKEQKDSLIATSFYQGARNNCASIALIKAAILKYGYDNLFSFRKQGGVYNVTLKNGEQLNVSEQERQSAIRNAGFNFNIGAEQSLGKEQNSIKFYSYLTYAILGKYMSTYGYWGCALRDEKIKPFSSYEAAIYYLSYTSLCTDNIYRLLGLDAERHFDYNGTDILNQSGTVVYGDRHAVAAFNNKIDCYGSWINASTSACDVRLKYYFTLK